MDVLRGGVQIRDAIAAAQFVRARGALARARLARCQEWHLSGRFQEQGNSVFQILEIMKVKRV